MVLMNMAATPCGHSPAGPSSSCFGATSGFYNLLYFALLSNYPLESQLQVVQNVGLPTGVPLMSGTCSKGMME